MKILLPAILLAGCAVAAVATDVPRIIYSKSFPGSVPPWVGITIDKSGAGEYREDPKDEDPLKFQLTETESAQIFALADKLNHFSRPLEAHLKVANMGMKSFRYEADGQASETKFNYSEDLDARALADWFERITSTERAYIDLERTVKFDKLGVQNSILQIEILRDDKKLIDPAQFLPLLERVTKNDTYMHIARERAGALIDWIQAQPK
jgi:hypothetical protein